MRSGARAFERISVEAAVKIVWRILKIVALLVVVAAGVLAIHVWRTWDRIYDIPQPEVHRSSDPAVLRRGEYLVYGPAHCVECHASSYPEFQKVASGELVPLRGGQKFAAPPLGAIYSKNLTPDPETGIGRYTDGEIARMMRWSVRPNGRASARPLMPFHNMSQEDLDAIISYLRSRPPVRNVVHDNEFTLIGKIVKSLAPSFKPRDPESVTPPAASPAETMTRERGNYLARYVSNCIGCHTNLDDMTFAPVGPEFAGGEVMGPTQAPDADPKVWFTTPNLTPMPGSALMKFPDRATFIARFKVGGRHYPGSPMPWEAFARMSENDIGALYEFLHSLSAAAGPAGEASFRRQ
jgi:mono/diheme cytochrome c family protein